MQWGGTVPHGSIIDVRSGVITGFNAIWKPERPFPIDMASFAVNITLVMDNTEAGFSYDVPRGYQVRTAWVTVRRGICDRLMDEVREMVG